MRKMDLRPEPVAEARTDGLAAMLRKLQNAPDGLTPEEKRALLVELMTRGVSAEPTPEPQREPELFPLSQGQVALWFLHELAPQDPSYNVALPLRLRVALDVPRFKRCFESLLQRHPALRTEIVADANGPMQRAVPLGTVAWKEADGTTWSEAQVEAWLNEEALRPFELTRGPLYRLALLRRGEREQVFMLVAHHILFDGASARILVEELRELYAAGLQGREPVLPPIGRSFADHVRAELASLDSPDAAVHFEHWRRELDGAPSRVQLPARSKSELPAGAPNFEGADLRFDVPVQTAERLRALGEAEGATPFMVMLSALAGVVHRHSGQRDFVISAFVGLRDRELARTAGYFVNVIPVRVQLEATTTFRELLRSIRDRVLGGVEHARFPFSKLVQRLRPERSAEETPFQDVVFNMISANIFGGLASHFGARTGENAARDEDVLGLEAFALPKRAARFPLEVTFGEAGDGSLRGVFEYGTARYGAASMERMADHLSRLLVTAANDPDAKVADFPLLGERERQAIFADWNATRVELPEATLPALFEAQAQRTPEAIAVRCGDESLTYRGLDEAATALAGHLRGLGVGPNVPVGICLDRSVRMLTAMLATLKAGGAYVPLDPGFPQERVRYMAQHSQMVCLLTQEKHAGLFAEDGPRIVRLDVEPIGTASPSESAPQTAAGPEDLAYVIYTSGSTGQPKGVQIPHRALTNLLRSMQKAPGLSPTDRLLAVTTISFDIAALELFLPLITGAQVDIAPREDTVDGDRFRALLEQREITVCQATPASWRMVLQAGWQGSPGLKILCGGEGMPPDIAEQLLARSSELWNVYGPTETTVWSTAHRVLKPSAPVPVGRAIDNTVLRILDPQGHAVPVGVTGELFIGGTGLARGYHRQPELTADRFVTLAIDGLPPERLYRTGDVARWTEEGTVEVLGRSDNQVKIRGFRVELGEIEAVLARHPEVGACAVVARTDSPGDARLHGYVVPKVGQLQASALRTFLGEHLPPYMVPAITFLEAMPLTPNGKVDRRALPKPHAAVSVVRDAALPPAAEACAQVWAEVLNISPTIIGLEDSFFALGGHSLLLASLAKKLEARFNRAIRTADLYAHPTLDSMSGWLAGTHDNVSGALESGADRGALVRSKMLRRRVRNS